MELNDRIDDKEFSLALKLIGSKYPSLDLSKIRSIYLKKMPNADLVLGNKSSNHNGKTSHIAVTGKSIDFFKSILGDCLLNNSDNVSGGNLDAVFDLYVDGKYNSDETDKDFVKTQCAIWLNRKSDSVQLGLSKKAKDGSSFSQMRKDIKLDDLLVFFKYLDVNNEYIYAITVKSNDTEIRKFSPNYSNEKIIKYYEKVQKNLIYEINANLIGSNLIVYGAPGSGKSFHVKNDFEDVYSKRVLFHSEYQYSDFVGHISPIIDFSNNEKRLYYDFVNGPFTDILISALEDNQNMYTLIIEEINRANASTVFGDVFQLLDRNEFGISDYSIYNMDIYKQIKNKLGDAYNYDIGTVFIPNNLTIVATMNNSDQNTFSLDTAFKRRWEFKYIPISFESHAYKDEEIEIFNISWSEFVVSINSYMLSEENSDLMISEDKQIGQFFASIQDIKDFHRFSYKVLLYLWDDVFKYSRDRIFKQEIRSFDSLVDHAKSDGFDVFSESFIKHNASIEDII